MKANCAKPKAPGILFVDIREAKPNKMFSEEQRAAIRFLIYSRPVACAECGKKKKSLWTMICQFRAHSMENIFAIKKSEKSHPPLAGVCGDHMLEPDYPEVKAEAAHVQA